jgi:hypothetical protein
VLRSLFDNFFLDTRRPPSGLNEPFQADFPKSRVHAKLLRRLILECYQNINTRLMGTMRSGLA